MNLGSYRVGRFSHLLEPGLGWCLKCKTTWRFVQEHSTQYTQSSGCFPLCEECWAELNIEERLPFYRQLIEKWYERYYVLNGKTFDETWALVEAAVRRGL